MPSPAIALIVGLGNPGRQYAETRHNAGFWFLQTLQKSFGFSLQEGSRYKGMMGSFSHQDLTVRVLAPHTFMNLSGDSVVPYARFFRIRTEQILVAHDELDLPPGSIRFKQNGGHGGHNGLRDIMQKTGARDMKRLRIGIGHPKGSLPVSGYVLTRPTPEDRVAIQSAIDRAVMVFPAFLAGDFPKIMQFLHTD